MGPDWASLALQDAQGLSIAMDSEVGTSVLRPQVGLSDTQTDFYMSRARNVLQEVSTKLMVAKQSELLASALELYQIKKSKNDRKFSWLGVAEGVVSAIAWTISLISFLGNLSDSESLIDGQSGKLGRLHEALKTLNIVCQRASPGESIFE